MQNLMRERQMAMQMARARELFNWWASFYSLAGLAMVAGSVIFPIRHFILDALVDKPEKRQQSGQNFI